MPHNDKTGGDGEKPYRPDTVEGLRVRVAALEQMVEFLHAAFKALRSYGVDFHKLPEWKDQSKLDAARRVTPSRATDLVWEFFSGLNKALGAAIRRSQLKAVKGGKAIEEEAKKLND